MLLEKSCNLSFHCRKIYVASVSFDLIKVNHPREFVFANEIDFIFTLAIPPTANPGVIGIFDKFPMIVAFQRNARKYIEIGVRQIPQSLEFTQFH